MGLSLNIGRGVINVSAFLAALKQIGYARTMGFEYKKDAGGPMPGLAESVGYARGVRDTLS